MMRCNYIRQELYKGLFSVFQSEAIEDKRSQALFQIQSVINNLQENYRAVIDSFNLLKIKLLK